ncbi:MAG: DUF3021 family protein [Lachnospiraceae bacterium]|nr:DUF3021 family protein [Lachnospiraceae bacterium]
MRKFKKFMALEIGIEFKACIYFCMILFFYFMYQILQGSMQAGIIIMTEMIFTAYGMCYIQIYLLNNFDEVDNISLKDILAGFGCSVLYTLLGYVMKWFDRNDTATISFFFYIMFCYCCIWLIYKIKREVDTALLNEELEQFKQRKNNV